MSPKFPKLTCAVALAAMLALGAPAFAQVDEADAEMRIQRLENQLRQLTGQNEELQFRNRQLEERLRQVGGDTPMAPPGQPAAAQPGFAQPGVAAMPPAQASPAYRPTSATDAQCHNRTHALQQPSGRTFPAVSFVYLSVECPFNKFYGINCRPKLGAKLLDRFFHRRRQVSPPVNNATHRFFDGSQHFLYRNFTVGSRHSAVASSSSR